METHTHTQKYPTTGVRMATTKGSFNAKAGVIKNLPVPALIMSGLHTIVTGSPKDSEV